jgi:SAM-dependent methyltransferase
LTWRFLEAQPQVALNATRRVSSRSAAELSSLIRVIRKIAGQLASGDFAQLTYELQNKLRGVDLEFVSVEDLGLSPQRAHFHSSSGGSALARVFKQVGVPPGSVAVDLGSGKGGAAFTLSRLGFREVVGVELSPVLVEIARRNADRLGRSNVRFVVSDAAEFHQYDSVTHVYMYNPFPCSVMARVMENLRSSIEQAPRNLTLVYRHPICHSTIMASGLFEAGEEHQLEHHMCRLYRSSPSLR